MKIHPVVWQGLNWMMVLILAFVSFFFVADSISDYKSTRSSFTHEVLPIKEQPSVSVCFGEQEGSLWKREMHNMTEIDIIYYDARVNYSKIVLQLGDNFSPDLPGEVINLRQMQKCYLITVKSDNYQHKGGRRRYIKVVMKKQDLLYKTPAYFFITDQANSFGVENKKFYEGKEFSVKLDPGHIAFTTITPTVTKLLKEKSNCREEPFWIQFEPVFVTDVQRSCQNPCFPQGLPNDTLAICEDFVDWKCANQVLKKLLRDEKRINTNPPCTWLEYQGRLNQYQILILTALYDQVKTWYIMMRYN